jgi:anaerobic selenocysteine-containing dehydrogenase
MNRLGDALSRDRRGWRPGALSPAPHRPAAAPEDAGPPVKALIVYNSNPAAVTPDQNAVHAGLRRDYLFTVVLEHFQTDTADYADYVLPATTQLEHWDIHQALRPSYLSLNRPAIAPVGASAAQQRNLPAPGCALGYDEPCFH